MPDTAAPAAIFSARDKTTAQRWARCQPGAPRLPGEAASGAAVFSLESLDPGAKPFSGGNKAEDKAAVEALVDELHQCGRDVTRSAIFAALHQPGALRVDLTAPAADIAITADQAAYCTGITLTLGITGE